MMYKGEDLTLSDLLTESAGRTPRKTCIKFEKRKVSYSELDELVSLCTGGLRALGLEALSIADGACSVTLWSISETQVMEMAPGSQRSSSISIPGQHYACKEHANVFHGKARLSAYSNNAP